MPRPAIGPRVVFFIDQGDLDALDRRAAELHIPRGELIRYGCKLALHQQLSLDELLTL